MNENETDDEKMARCAKSGSDALHKAIKSSLNSVKIFYPPPTESKMKSALHYQENNLNIFIGWSGRREEEYAKILKEELIKGFSIKTEMIFLSSNSMTSGPDKQQILEAIKKCSVYILLISKCSIISDWLWYEAGYAQRDTEIKKRKIFPICLFGFSIDDFKKTPIGELQAFCACSHESLKSFTNEISKKYKLQNKVNIDAICIKASNIKPTHPRETRKSSIPIPDENASSYRT